MADTARRSTVLHYCHHSVGLGHLVRSLAVAGALAEHHRVVLCSGGRVPAGLSVPPGVEIVALPPVGRAPDGELVSQTPGVTLDEARTRRRALLLACFADLDPDVVLVELFPFGRRKFAPEILALLDLARSAARRPKIVSSVRDLLVTGHPDKQRHDDEAAQRLDAYFDAVIVHGDPRFAHLEDTFRPATWPRVPILYSGFVRAATAVPAAPRRPGDEVVVSAGGGLSGARLFDAAVDAHVGDFAPRGLRTRIVTGPFLPADDFAGLLQRSEGCAGLSVERFVADLGTQMAGAAVTVSQCGYNTALDILLGGAPAVVVPFAEAGDDEQVERARRLSAMGLVEVVAPEALSASSLAQAVLAARRRPRRTVAVDVGGAATAASLIGALAPVARGASTPPPTLPENLTTRRHAPMTAPGNRRPA